MTIVKVTRHSAPWVCGLIWATLLGAAPPDPSAPDFAGRRGVTLYVSKSGDNSSGASWKTALWDRWIVRHVYATGADAGVFWDIRQDFDKPSQPLTILVEDCVLMGYKVFGSGGVQFQGSGTSPSAPDDGGPISYTIGGRVQAYVRFDQLVPEGFERLDAWPAGAFSTIVSPGIALPRDDTGT